MPVAGSFFGLTPLPPAHSGLLAALAIAYLALVNTAKTWFFKRVLAVGDTATR
ncbi:MAG: hypothetical protein NVSMB19_19980 [Vulcanimicrobiaceae bacterium]